MGRGEFYRDWFRRAFSGKIAKAQAASGLAAIVAAAAIWFAKRHPAMSDWIPFTTDQTMVVIFFGVFLATVVLGFILAPYDMHVEEADSSKRLEIRLNQLEASAAPDLNFGALLPPERFRGGQTVATLYRIPIRNTSDTRALHNVEVMISVTKPDGSSKTEARAVKDTDGRSAWDLNPGGMKLIDLVAVRPDKRPPRAYIAPYLPGLSERSIVGEGAYTAFLEATCRETRKLQGRFKLTLTGDGNLRLEETA